MILIDAVFAEEYYYNIINIINNDQDNRIKVRELGKLLNEILNKILINENRSFNSTQTKILYIKDKYNLDLELFNKLNQASLFITKSNRNKKFKVYLNQVFYIAKAVAKLINLFSSASTPQEILNLNAVDYLFKLEEKESLKTDEPIKVIVKEISYIDNQINYLCNVYDSDEEITILLNNTITSNDEYFNYLKNIPRFTKIYFFSLKKSLTKENVYHTNINDYFVIEPDFLIDVSDISSCFMLNGYNFKVFFLDKMFFSQSNKSTIRGNIVNNILDLCITEKQDDFEYLFNKAAEKNLMAISMLSEQDFEDIKLDVKENHFNQLIKFSSYLLQLKEEQNVKISIEPTFYSDLYGLQGRLDVMVQFLDEPERIEIIELKSGKPANSGVWKNEEMQAIGYDLLIQSVFGINRKGSNNIFYSRYSDKMYRNIKRTTESEVAFSKVRNLILCEILRQADGDFSLYNTFNTVSFGTMPPYLAETIQKFYNVYSLADNLSKKYFCTYTSFIWNELLSVKLGNRTREQDNDSGFAALWLNDVEEKKERFNIIDNLIFKEYDEIEKTYTFSYNGILSNFRKNDIAIIYKQSDELTNPIKQQIYKCTLENITFDEVKIALRNEQPEINIFNLNETYCLEHDLFDKNYYGIIASLFNFLAKPLDKKELLLGKKLPVQNKIELNFDNYNQFYIKKATLAKNYFLLQGPPGTGKTSTFLINYISNLYLNTDNNIMIITFTNRSLEEIIKHLQKINFKFVLISSSSNKEYSFKTILKTNKFNNKPFEEYRICLATVSSYLLYQNEINYHFKVNTLVIDEASQIAEYQIIGVLGNFDKFVMIGDQNQLPAISVQSDDFCKLYDEDLNNIGIYNLKDSFFERLFNICKKNNLTNNYDILVKHYRMHSEIAELINKYYDNKLICGSEHQKSDESFLSNIDLFGNTPFKNRVIFIDVNSNNNNLSKSCIEEAEVTKTIINKITEKITDIDEDTIGVVTPFRAQITLLRNVLGNNPFLDKIQIDTIERYQGSEKKIIIISFGVSAKYQLSSISSFNSFGTLDRKLNVALSRAKDYLILIGNYEILKLQPHIKEVINFIKSKFSYINFNIRYKQGSFWNIWNR